MSDEKRKVHNGNRIAVDWPDFKGKVGLQTEGLVIQASYRPNAGGDKPVAGNHRTIGTVRYKVLKVARNPHVSGFVTLDLEVA